MLGRAVTALLAAAAVVQVQGQGNGNGGANPTCATQQSGCSPVNNGKNKNEKVEVKIDTGGLGGPDRRRHLREGRPRNNDGTADASRFYDCKISGAVELEFPGDAATHDGSAFDEACDDCFDWVKFALAHTPSCSAAGFAMNAIYEDNAASASVDDPEFPLCSDCSFEMEPVCLDVVEDNGSYDFELVAQSLKFECKLPYGASKCTVVLDVFLDGAFAGHTTNLVGDIIIDGYTTSLDPFAITPLYEAPPRSAYSYSYESD